VGEAIARQSFVSRFGAAPTSSITTAIQTKLVNRVALLLRNKPHETLETTAQRIVDVVLAEVA
jgi:hypothetical protein